MDKDPFGGFPLVSYAWVLAIACAGGLVKHLNGMQKLRAGKLAIDLFTSGFTGILTFWFCEYVNIHGPGSALMIAIGGMMGNRAWRIFEEFWQAKLGLPQHRKSDDQVSEDEDK